MNTDSHPLDSTRKLASEALERASSTVKDLRSNVQDAASRGMSAVSDRARYLGEYAGNSTRYVSENPLKAALIAAAVGAAVAGLVLVMRSRRGSDRY
ncbi:MAG: hypothetical protein JWP22_4099 [Ramlibacter sp.]|jgi:ElaB/YqjD/DUF883 family membrane-anchored ribosome-binding protein|nr:hypothetical protein [Ramlibacter sp.]MDB5915424.1 hypothetical protein [Ramlibacter sp.]